MFQTKFNAILTISWTTYYCHAMYFPNTAQSTGPTPKKRIFPSEESRSSFKLIWIHNRRKNARRLVVVVKIISRYLLLRYMEASM